MGNPGGEGDWSADRSHGQTARRPLPPDPEGYPDPEDPPFRYRHRAGQHSADDFGDDTGARGFPGIPRIDGVPDDGFPGREERDSSLGGRGGVPRSRRPADDLPARSGRDGFRAGRGDDGFRAGRGDDGFPAGQGHNSSPAGRGDDSFWTGPAADDALGRRGSSGLHGGGRQADAPDPRSRDDSRGDWPKGRVSGRHDDGFAAGRAAGDGLAPGSPRGGGAARDDMTRSGGGRRAGGRHAGGSLPADGFRAGLRPDSSRDDAPGLGSRADGAGPETRRRRAAASETGPDGAAGRAVARSAAPGAAAPVITPPGGFPPAPASPAGAPLSDGPAFPGLAPLTDARDIARRGPRERPLTGGGYLAGAHGAGSSPAERDLLPTGRGESRPPTRGRSAADPSGASGDGTAARGSRGPLRGFPPLPGQPDPVYPPGQFSLWNRPSVRTAWLGLAPSADTSREHESDPGYAHLAVSDSSADATSTQTWAAIEDTGSWAAPKSGPRVAAYTDHGTYPGGSQEPPRALGSVAGPAREGRSGTGSPPATRKPAGRRSPWDISGDGGEPGDTSGGTPATGDFVDSATAARPGARGQSPGGRPAGRAGADRDAGGGRGAARGAVATRAAAVRARRGGGSARSNRLLAVLLATPVLVVIGVVGFLVMNSGSAGPSRPAAAASPKSVPSSPAPTLGPWRHIDSRADDPRPLTLTELFPARFTSAGVAGTQSAKRATTNCTHAVIGGGLRSAVHKAGCTQAMRASYLSSNRKMMATIGVLNLATATEANRVGKASGRSEFIRQLPGRHGPTKKLTQGTGLEEAEYKGHYLILVWGEFANLHTPSSKRQKLELEQFLNALINGTVNLSLSSRMVTGQPMVAP